MFKPLILMLAVLLLATACLAHGGELRLDNGAVLPGELVSVGATTLVWKADKIGAVTVAKADVLSLQESSRIPVELAPRAGRLNDCLVGVKDSLWSVECPKETLHALAYSELRSLPPATGSTGKFSTSLDIDRGANPSEEVKVDLTARWWRPGYRHNAYLSVDYEQSNGSTTDDNADTHYQYDLLRDRGWYWYGRVRYYRDEFEALQQVYGAGPGIGREFSPADNLSLSLQGGPALMYYYYQDKGWQTEPGSNVRWTAVWQTPWRGIYMTHSGELGRVFSISDGYLFQSRTGVTVPLYQGLVAELRLDYDRSGVKVGDNGNYDMEWVLGLGYHW